jgi:hypothetical protein
MDTVLVVRHFTLSFFVLPHAMQTSLQHPARLSLLRWKKETNSQIRPPPRSCSAPAPASSCNRRRGSHPSLLPPVAGAQIGARTKQPSRAAGEEDACFSPKGDDPCRHLPCQRHRPRQRWGPTTVSHGNATGQQLARDASPRPHAHATRCHLDAIPRPGPLMPPDRPPPSRHQTRQSFHDLPLWRWFKPPPSRRQKHRHLHTLPCRQCFTPSLLHATGCQPLASNEGPTGMAYLLFTVTNFDPVQRLSVPDQQICESAPFLLPSPLVYIICL